jgi:heptose-I-phosphate ethanolaminephosphotransferase
MAHRTIFALLCAFLAILNLVNAHIRNHWGATNLESRIGALIDSTPDEIGDYLRIHIDALDFLFIGITCGYLFLLAFFAIYRYEKLKCLRVETIVVLIAWLSVFFVVDMHRRVTEVEPVNSIMATWRVNGAYERLQERRAFLEQNELANQSCNIKYQKIVIVIGESANADHMSAFGYGRPTTPFVDSSNPHKFLALAPSNQTRFSLPMMLTSASPGEFEPFYTEHSLVSRFRACGYQTLWVSNQGRIGIADSFAAYLAREAHDHEFLNSQTWKESTHDGAILAELDKRDIYRRQNQVTIVHLMGSHSPYERRVPADFSSADVLDVVAAYDQTILYTDTILAELYQKFQDDKLLFVYVSDHGEVVSQSRLGHGFDPAYKDEFKTALFIWTRDVAAVDRISSVIGFGTLNLDSFAEIMSYLVGLTDDPKVSTDDAVSVLRPENVVRYQSLESLTDQLADARILRDPESKSNK